MTWPFRDYTSSLFAPTTSPIGSSTYCRRWVMPEFCNKKQLVASNILVLYELSACLRLPSLFAGFVRLLVDTSVPTYSLLEGDNAI